MKNAQTKNKKNAYALIPLLRQFMNKMGMPLIAVTLFLLFSCSKDDDGGDSFSSVQPAQATFTTLNACDIGGSVAATEFRFSISYQASEGTEIDEIEFDIRWSDGDTDSADEDNFGDSGSNVTYDWCYRFGSLDWVEVTHRLVSKDGTKSPPSTVRINKPEGAN